MTPSELLQQLSNRQQECDALAALWKSVINSECPDDHQFCIWLGLHDFNTVVFGLRETAATYQRLKKQMTPEHLLRYASKTMNAQKSRMQAATQRQMVAA
jgi:hypothetical protein